MPSKDELKKLLLFAEKNAKNAGKILLKEQKRVRIVKHKDVQDIVTTADLASEKYIIEEILKKYPKHTIVSEERGVVNAGSDYHWVIDPLDGTKEFIRDIPLFNVSIALEFERETIIACVYRPSENTLYSAAKDIGSFRDGRKIKVSSIKSLEEAFVYCYLPSYHRQKEKYNEAWEKLGLIGKNVYRLRALADENTALCWLAQGGIEAYLNLSNPPKWHDIAPGLLIAEKAGAIVSDTEGKILETTEVKSLVVTNSREIHKQIIAILQ